MNSNGQGQSDHGGRRQGAYTVEHGVGGEKGVDMRRGRGHTVGTRWAAKLLALLSAPVLAELQARLRMAPGSERQSVL